MSPKLRRKREGTNPHPPKNSRADAAGPKADVRLEETLAAPLPTHSPSGSGVRTPCYPSQVSNKDKKIGSRNTHKHRGGEGRSPHQRPPPLSRNSSPVGASPEAVPHDESSQDRKKRKHALNSEGGGEGDQQPQNMEGGPRSFKKRKEDKGTLKHGDHKGGLGSQNAMRATGSVPGSPSVSSSSSAFHGKRIREENKTNGPGGEGSEPGGASFSKRREERDKDGRRRSLGGHSPSPSSAHPTAGSNGSVDGGFKSSKKDRKKSSPRSCAGDVPVLPSSASSSPKTLAHAGPSPPSASSSSSDAFASARPFQHSTFYPAPKTPEDRVRERKRSVFVTQLPLDAEKEELQQLFSRFGDIAAIKVVGGGGE